jgi:hypothetical protein
MDLCIYSDHANLQLPFAGLMTFRLLQLCHHHHLKRSALPRNASSSVPLLACSSGTVDLSQMNGCGRSTVAPSPSFTFLVKPPTYSLRDDVDHVQVHGILCIHFMSSAYSYLVPDLSFGACATCSSQQRSSRNRMCHLLHQLRRYNIFEDALSGYSSMSTSH